MIPLNFHSFTQISCDVPDKTPDGTHSVSQRNGFRYHFANDLGCRNAHIRPQGVVCLGQEPPMALAPVITQQSMSEQEVMPIPVNQDITGPIKIRAANLDIAAIAQARCHAVTTKGQL